MTYSGKSEKIDSRFVNDGTPNTDNVTTVTCGFNVCENKKSVREQISDLEYDYGLTVLGRMY